MPHTDIVQGDDILNRKSESRFRLHAAFGGLFVSALIALAYNEVMKMSHPVAPALFVLICCSLGCLYAMTLVLETVRLVRANWKS